MRRLGEVRNDEYIADETHDHPISDVTGLQTALDGKSATGHTHVKANITDFAHTHGASDVPAVTALTGFPGGTSNFLRADGTFAAPPGGSGGGDAIYINLVNHFTTLENTTSANATWKIPAATTYGQVAVYLDMVGFGTPASAKFVAVYTNTATTGTNRIGLRIGSAPLAAGTTVTPIASSDVTMVNSATYPQTIVKDLTVSELGTSAVWAQIALNLATSTVGPNLMHAAVILYY